MNVVVYSKKSSNFLASTAFPTGKSTALIIAAMTTNKTKSVKIVVTPTGY